MRPVIVVALLGTALSMSPANAQDGSDASGSGAKKSKAAKSNVKYDGSLFENGPPLAHSGAHHSASHATKEAETAPEPAPVEPPAQVPVVPTVQAVPPGPPQKNLTGEEFARLHVGSTEKEVLAVLGPPSSRVIVPDDDHLRESFQYWSKGRPVGTVRLDNGRVVQIETESK
ncbi:MAG: hypothetical protein JOZ32_11865 [Bryobacterales bacterium]|nr:hypothetical protein [Bryobacterales bacterium]